MGAATLGDFSDILALAASLHEGEAAVLASLPEGKSDAELSQLPDSVWLEAMAKVIMRTGFSWKVVDNKWPGFEAAFVGFDPNRVAMFSDEDFDRLLSDTAIIRNGQKLRAICDNAIMITDLQRSHGSASAFFATWPHGDFTGLWAFLKKRGSRLGGNTGPYMLREVSWDTPVMSKDVVKALIREGVIEKAPTSQKALKAVQDAFNEWRLENGLTYAQMSRILALSVG
jgi:3-methyladenine DNA glycosylase Tag